MDQELRDAERLHRETGRVEDKGRLLVAQVRAGLLDEERVALAARLGDAAAALAVRDAPARAPAVSHPWHAEVRAALARRLLDPSGAAPAKPRVVELRGPPGTNDGRRFVLPPHEELLARLAGADPWALTGQYGEGELVALARGSRARFGSLAEFWVDVALPHEDLFLGYSGRFSWVAAARVLIERERAVRSIDDPHQQTFGHGFAPAATVAGLRRLLPPGPFRRALRLDDDWNEKVDVLETDDALVLAAWSTSA